MDSRQPPQDLDAERALLGSMEMSAGVIDEVVLLVRNDDFALDQHRVLFRELVELNGQGVPMDFTVVVNELRKRGTLDAVGGQDYLVLLADSFADWANADHYARIVAEKSRLRRLIRLGLELRESAYAIDADSQEIAANYAERVGEVVQGGRESASIDTAILLGQLGERLAEQGSTVGFIETPFPRLNQLVGGIEEAGLTILGARTSQGKTAFALNLVAHAASVGIPSLFISVEMDRWRIGERLVSIATGRSVWEAKRNATPDELRELTHQTREWIGGQRRLYVADGPSILRIQDSVALARAHVRKYGVRLVVVDYLQKVRPAERSNNRYLEVGEITRRLKELAVATGAAVVVPCQVGPDPENRRPTLRDLRESGDIEQDADVVALLWADADTARENTRTVLLDIAKNRNGPKGTLELRFHTPTQRFSEARMEAQT